MSIWNIIFFLETEQPIIQEEGQILLSWVIQHKELQECVKLNNNSCCTKMKLHNAHSAMVSLGELL